MIQLLSQNHLDLKKYDSCVQRDVTSLPYAHSWYLNSVCEQWECLVLDDYEAVWPLPYRRKWGQKYYFRPYGVQQLGIYSKKELSDEVIASFLAELSRQVRFADIYLNEGQKLEINSKTSWQFQGQPNLLLEMGRSYEKIYQGFNTNLRRKLKKSSKENFELFENDGPEVLLKLFRENQGEELKLPEAFYRDFKKLLFQLMHKGLAQIYTLYGGPNQLVAGAFFLQYRERSIFLFSATSDYGKNTNAMAHLINEYIIFHSEKFKVLDFEGSKQAGLARFYASFGAQEIQYPRLYLNRLPWPLSSFRR